MFASYCCGYSRYVYPGNVSGLVTNLLWKSEGSTPVGCVTVRNSDLEVINIVAVKNCI